MLPCRNKWSSTIDDFLKERNILGFPKFTKDLNLPPRQFGSWPKAKMEHYMRAQRAFIVEKYFQNDENLSLFLRKRNWPSNDCYRRVISRRQNWMTLMGITSGFKRAVPGPGENLITPWSNSPWLCTLSLWWWERTCASKTMELFLTQLHPIHIVIQ